MVRRWFVFTLITLQMLTTCGCWDSKDLEDLSIPIVGTYDVRKNEEGETNGVVVSGIFPTLSKEAEEKVETTVIPAQTIGESRGKRGARSPEAQIFGLMQVGIYGEELARQGLDNVTDANLRFPTVKKALYMAVVDEGRAEDLVSVPSKTYPNMGVYLLHLLRNAPKDSFIPSTTLHSFAVNAHSTGKNPIVPLLKAVDAERVDISGAGIFKKDRLIAKVNLQDTKTLVLLRGVKARGYIPFVLAKKGEKADEGTVLVNNSRKVKVERKGDDFTFTINIKLKGVLLEHYSEVKLLEKEDLLKEIENTVKMDTEKECRKFVKKMQKEFKVDCIDITRFAMAKWRNELKGKVDEGFIEDVKINVNANVDLVNFGEIQ